MPIFKQFQRLQKLTGNFLGIFAILALCFLATTIFLGWQVFELRKPASSAEARVRELVDEVSMAIILPQDELPTVAKVADASKLNDQPFFFNARTGDDILIYEKAQKAILWRPSVRRVVEVSSLSGSSVLKSSATTSQE